MKVNASRSTTGRLRAALSAAVVLCAVTAVLPAAASAEPTATAGPVGAGAAGDGVERISVAADGTQGGGDSADASITPDGRHVVFSSSAGNLSPDQADGGAKVFLRDQQTRQTKRIGYLTTLEPPTVSGDGAYVAYAVRWMRNVRITQFQVGTGRSISANCSYSCDQPAFNADGSYLAFATLIQKPSPSQRIDVQGSDHKLVTAATLDHVQPSRPSISGDGRYVAYQDSAAGTVFVWDRTSGTTSDPVQGPQGATLVQLSDDGTKVVYLSGADTYVHDVPSDTDQLVPNARGVAIDPTGRYLLYAPQGTTGPSLALRDLRTDTDRTVSDQPASAGAHAVSADGHDVVFQSTAGGIVPGDANGKSQVFVRHFG
ncbi:hypothetical protein ABTY61_00160 [Kitasatospora sp. NPDC096128]|uniref:TolB family protein n=1 Tax=Kitasatospora sp. NPDC096128 TaxID=3155547 RepID=UPI003320F40E